MDMETKKCSKCGNCLPLDSFYTRSEGKRYKSACKDCTNQKARDMYPEHKPKLILARAKYYEANKEQIKKKHAEYRRSERGKESQKKATKKFMSTEKGRLSARMAYNKWQKNNRYKRRAHWAVKSAIKAGKLIRKPCEVCGTIVDVNAHHEDYSKPFDINWLCMKHHTFLHRTIK